MKKFSCVTTNELCKKKIEDSKKELIPANSPHAVTECIKVITERKESLRTWSELSKVSWG